MRRYVLAADKAGDYATVMRPIRPLVVKGIRIIALATIACLAVPSLATAEGIHLVCDGTGTVSSTETTSVSSFDSGHTISASGHVTVNKQVDSEVLVDVNGQIGRIKMPPNLVPIVHSGSDDGWRPFDFLQVGEKEIRGRFRLNFISKPEVTINRITGHIHISANSRSFSGDCQPYDATAATRKF